MIPTTSDNDTHTDNMRDILTNDGNPSGVNLPDDAYGMVLISSVSGLSNELRASLPIGNFRIIDNNGYEYRTNAQSALLQDVGGDGFSQSEFYSFNYNIKSGVSLSDVVGITYSFIQAENPIGFEATALPPQALQAPTQAAGNRRARLPGCHLRTRLSGAIVPVRCHPCAGSRGSPSGPG